MPPPNETLASDAVSAYASARLFAERAQLARPDFRVTNGNASAIATICARLDGLPLAIELAASRSRSMSVVELSARLDRRFSLLKDGSHAALPRHRSLQSVLDWSYELLGEPDRAMLRRCAVFAGGWTLESTEHVCTDDGVDAADSRPQLRA